MKHIETILRFLRLASVAVIIVIATSSCTRSHSTNSSNTQSAGPTAPTTPPGPSNSDVAKTGGQDGGGGHLLLSSVSEVKSALEEVLTIAKDSHLESNLFYAFGEAQFGGYADSNPNDPWSGGGPYDEGVPNKLFKILDGRRFECSKYNYAPAPPDCPKDSKNPGDILLKKFALLMQHVQFNLLATGDCGPERENHADASVDKFSLDATVCFSIEHLRRIAKASLVPEIAGLLIHEAAHMEGYDEATAQLIQRSFANFYSTNFASDGRHSYQTQADQALESIRQNLSRLQNDPKISDAEMENVLGEIRLQLFQLPYWYMPLKIRIAFHLRTPALPYSYLYSVWLALSELPKCSSQLVQGCAIIRNVARADMDQMVVKLIPLVANLRSVWAAIAGELDGRILCPPRNVNVSNIVSDMRDYFFYFYEIPPPENDSYAIIYLTYDDSELLDFGLCENILQSFIRSESFDENYSRP